MSKIMKDDAFISDVYDEYIMEAYGKDVKSKEDCIQILKEIVEAGIEL